MTALVLAALIGLATAWVKSDEISKLLDTFQKMVLELVKRVLLPVLPVFIAANFCILSYQGAVTKQLPVFLSVLIVVIVCHFTGCHCFISLQLFTQEKIVGRY